MPRDSFLNVDASIPPTFPIISGGMGGGFGFGGGFGVGFGFIFFVILFLFGLVSRRDLIFGSGFLPLTVLANLSQRFWSCFDVKTFLSL